MNSAYPNCTYELRKQGVPYPRTCAECGLGPCKAGHFVPAPKPVSEIDTLRAENAALRASRDELLEALQRLLKAADEHAIAETSEELLCEAANDPDADPAVREQAAAVLQVRAAIRRAASTGQPD
jgi:hypothetical protein